MINKISSGNGVETSEAEKTKKVRELNDNLRQTFQGGQVVVTHGFNALDDRLKAEIANKIRNFNDFTPDNDPYQEHDFGKVEVEGIRCFWKIDYYDENMQYHSSDKSNPEVTSRVMTIMRAEEY